MPLLERLPLVDRLLERLPVLDRRVVAALALALAIVAIAGYVAGHGHARAPQREQTLTASVAGVLLTVPQEWQATSSAPAIPGLTLAHPIQLAPNGEATHAGLVAGAIPGRDPSPLPQELLDSARGLPATSVVTLLEVQAYRYTNFSLPGYDGRLAVYVVPNPGGDRTALACYAEPAFASQMQACQHIVATLTLAGRTQSYDLTPQGSYAQGLSASIGALERARLALRRQLGPHTAPATAGRVAARLAAAFAQAASSVSALQPTLATGQAQSALSGALLSGRSAYAALAAAAQASSEPRFAVGRERVGDAEARVDDALATYALLGYQPA
jgi:hypothetical protein